MTEATPQAESKRKVLLYPGEDGYFVVEVPSLPGCISQLRSCTWKYGCQNHNYVQWESSAQFQVKQETQLFEGK